MSQESYPIRLGFPNCGLSGVKRYVPNRLLTALVGAILVSTEAAQRAKTVLSRDVLPVAREPDLEALAVESTQRPQGLMTPETGSNNKRSVNLYTPVWLGCSLSFGTCVLSPRSCLLEDYYNVFCTANTNSVLTLLIRAIKSTGKPSCKAF